MVGELDHLGLAGLRQALGLAVSRPLQAEPEIAGEAAAESRQPGARCRAVAAHERFDERERIAAVFASGTRVMLPYARLLVIAIQSEPWSVETACSARSSKDGGSAWYVSRTVRR